MGSMISSDPRYIDDPDMTERFFPMIGDLVDAVRQRQESQRRWDTHFLDIAEVVRQKSKDPSSKIGAVLTIENSIFSTGFNGFPMGVDETDPARWERPIKYEYVCHAERNAIALAARKGSATKGATLYLVGFGPPTAPCTECTKMIIQSGIVRVVGRPFIAA